MLHFDLEYPSVYFEKGSLPGFRTTKKTKRLGCTNLKLLYDTTKYFATNPILNQKLTFNRIRHENRTQNKLPIRFI